MRALHIIIVAAVSLMAVAAFGQSDSTTGTASNTASNTAAVATNSVATAGPITVITGDATGIALDWIAHHGSAGGEWFHSIKGNRSGPGVTETGWIFDLPWTTAADTNLDFKVGLTHADVFTKTVNQDLLGVELSADFFNGNIASTIHNWPVIGVLWRSLAKINLECTASISHTTDGLANLHIEGKNADWGVGVKVVKLF